MRARPLSNTVEHGSFPFGKREIGVTRRRASKQAPSPRWTFLSNHGHVVLCLARDEAVLMRDVARAVGITQRAVQRIVADLEAAGYLVRVRDGRQNRYVVRRHVALRHPVEAHVELGALIDLLGDES